MGIFYVNSDVGLAGGAGTQADPYGIETAIAAALPGDVFYWSGGGEGDVSPGHTLNFDNGGDASAPVRWIGCDEGYNPIPGQTPQAGVDAGDGAYSAIAVSADSQEFVNLRCGNCDAGSAGSEHGWEIAASHILMQNCQANDCGTGISSTLNYGAIVLMQCDVWDVGYGAVLGGHSVCVGCKMHDIPGSAFQVVRGGFFSDCQVWNAGVGVELRLNHLTYGKFAGFQVDGLSAYNCTDGVKINAHTGTQPNHFCVTNSLFDTMSGYAVNVTTPVGQMGYVLNNGSRACALGQVPAGRTGLVSEGWVALPGSPFVDAASGDLSLIRSTPAIGAALNGGDLGAIQRRFVRAPHPMCGAAIIG